MPHFRGPARSGTPIRRSGSKLELREHETLLSAAVGAGDKTLPVSSAYGWPVTGTGIIEGDTFSYTVDGNDLLLSSGIAGGHAEQAVLYPTVGGVTQTGWLVNRVVLKRPPGLSNLATGRCYLSHNTDCGTPDLDDIGDVTWESDYDWNAAYQNFSNQGGAESEVTFNVWPSTWARTVLVIWDAMSARERAKLNEIEVIIDPGWTADSYAFASIYQVLYYLLAEAGSDQLAGSVDHRLCRPVGSDRQAHHGHLPIGGRHGRHCRGARLRSALAAERRADHP